MLKVYIAHQLFELPWLLQWKDCAVAVLDLQLQDMNPDAVHHKALHCIAARYSRWSVFKRAARYPGAVYQKVQLGATQV